MRRDSALYWWLWNWRYRLLHPREWLCDSGVWKCDHHPRLLHLPEDRRWAWRHKLRARRIRSYTGWQPGELHALMELEGRRELEARLAGSMRAVVARSRSHRQLTSRTGAGVLHSHAHDQPCNDKCLSFPAQTQITDILPVPWQTRLAELAVEARRAGYEVELRSWRLP